MKYLNKIALSHEMQTQISLLYQKHGRRIYQKMPKRTFPYLLTLLVMTISYLTFFMSDRYASEAIIMIKKNASSPAVSGIGAALGLGDTISTEDERILLAYMQSPDILQKLDEELKLREHYSSNDIDILSRLPKNASREDFLAFYRQHVKIHQDGTTGLLNIEVQAFNSQFSLLVTQKLLQYAESFINDINLALAHQEVEFMRQEIALSENSLRKEKAAILEFQNQNQVINPEGQIQSLSTILSSLESQLIQEETQLGEYQSYLAPTASQIVTSQARIKALRDEIARQQRRVIGGKSDNLNQLNSEYVNLQLNLEFASNRYTTSLSAFERARAEASQKFRHMVVVSSPQAAEDAKYPQRFYWCVTWIFGFGLMIGAWQLTYTIIREHHD
ncbi:MAG: hypothetical protein ACOH5I_13060 [Oligoflexus sp.]